MGSPAAVIMDFLSAILSRSKSATVITAQPCSHTYTATIPAPHPASLPVVGVSESNPVPVMATAESKPDKEIPTTLKPIKTKIML